MVTVVATLQTATLQIVTTVTSDLSNTRKREEFQEDIQPQPGEEFNGADGAPHRARFPSLRAASDLTAAAPEGGGHSAQSPA